MGEGDGKYFDPMEIAEPTGLPDIDKDAKQMSINFTLSIFKVLLGRTYNENIWIDRGGNEYKCGILTRLYSYDATVENMMNYRCDLVYAPCEGENDEHYWITDPAEYFEQKAKMDENDHKSGKNQWMENFYKILAKRELQSKTTVNISKKLDYDLQEFIKKECCD